MQPRILRLRGLPWTVGEDEVRDFLQLSEGHEVYIRKRGELSTGEAYVELSSVGQANDILEAFNRRILGGRYIEIFHAEAANMGELKEKIREQDKGWVVRLRGLPFRSTERDILKFFGKVKVLNDLEGITIIYGREGRPVGEAYVELPDEENQIAALNLDRNRMESRYIEVFKSTKADLSVRLQSARRNEGVRRQWDNTPTLAMDGHVGLPGGNPGMMMVPYATVPAQAMQASPASPSLQLHGLPPDATEADVAHFFAEVGVLPLSIQFHPESTQAGFFAPGKSAYVTFASPAIAEAALQQSHRMLFKDQPIRVYLAPALPPGQSSLAGFQQSAVPMWSYPPAYMYDDLSKLLQHKSPGLPYSQPSPAARPGVPGPSMGFMPNPGMVHSQRPFGGGQGLFGGTSSLLRQSSGSPRFAAMPNPPSPARLPPQGLGRTFSPRHMPGQPGMLPASPAGMNQQQQMLLQQQQQLFLLQQQQQQQYLLHQQPSRMSPMPWNLPAQHAAGGGQYPPPSRPPSATYPGRSVPQQLQEIPPQATSDLLGEAPISAYEPATDLLSSLKDHQESLPVFGSLQAARRTSQPNLGRPPSGPGPFPTTSSDNLSDRQKSERLASLHLSDRVASSHLSDRVASLHLSDQVASLHLSDRAPSGRSHATSTTHSAPSEGLRANTSARVGSLGSQTLPEGSY